MNETRATDLRDGLDAITEERIPLGEHLQRIADLGRSQSHRIKGCEVPRTAGFNCFAFAFGLSDDPTYRQIAAVEARVRNRRFFANSDFAAHMLRRCLTSPVSHRDTQPNDLAFYTAKGRIVHAARVVSPRRFRSKWGRGHLYDHGLWEVPNRYGHLVRFYSAIEFGAVRRGFADFVTAHPEWCDFAKAAGIDAESIASGAGA